MAADARRRIRLDAGERLSVAVSETTPALVVASGAVLVRRASGAGRRVVVGVAGSDCAVRAPGADEEIVALTAAELSRAHPSREQLLAALRDREESLAILALPRHKDRVRAKLLQLARAHGKVTADGVAIALPLTHELVAEMTASARETVTWSLRALADEGVVRREGRRYVVRVPPDELRL